MSSPAAGIRLSFLTQVDQARYETLFTQASTDYITLSGKVTSTPSSTLSIVSNL
ncbi:unnamed protein product [Absidia cylindrospora]